MPRFRPIEVAKLPRHPLRESAASPTSTNYDIFLSHSRLDADVIAGIKAILERTGRRVYVDWIEDPQLDRSHVTVATAEVLRQRMQRSASLVFATSDNSPNFSATDEHEDEINFNLRRTLDLATNVQLAYQRADGTRRQLLNQSFFKRLTVHDDGHLESEFAEPYDVLLGPTLRARASAAIDLGEIVVSAQHAPETDWTTMEASFNDNTREELRFAAVDDEATLSHRQGLNTEILVGAGGFEPP